MELLSLKRLWRLPVASLVWAFILLGMRCVPCAAQGGCIDGCTPVVPTTTATVTLNPASLGRTIPANFNGISIETYSVLDLGTLTYPSSALPANVPADAFLLGGPTANASQEMVGTVMQTLGIKSLRIGGTTCEAPTDLVAGGSNPNAIYPPLYNEEFVASFAGQWGMEMFWCIPAGSLYNLNTYETYIANAVAAQQAAGQNFPFIVEVSNEPDISPAAVPVATYDAEFDAYLGAMRSGISPSIQIEGPEEAAETTYVNKLMTDPEFDSSTAPWHNNLAYLTLHFYISGQSSQSSANAAILAMLDFTDSGYLSNWNSWATTPTAYGYKTRIDETNSFSGGGKAGASNSFAAGLWGLDYLEYMSHNTGVDGLNFHEGTTGASYAPFMPQYLSPTYTLQGLGYGMIAFSTDGAGRVVPTTISGAGAGLNMTAYGTYLTNGSETAIVINRTSILAGTESNVTLTVVPGGSSYTTAAVYYLQAPNNDPTQTQFSSATGTWSGSPTILAANSDGSFTVPLSYSEAAVINMFNPVQTITFAPATPVTFGAAPIALTATGGGSGNPVTFTLLSGPATLAGNVLTITGAGSVVVTANQAGSDGYNAATPVTATIAVNPATPTVALTASADPALLQTAVTLTATVSSTAGTPANGDTVNFYDGATSLGPGTLSGGQATFATSSFAAGTHSITATFTGDANFAAATSSSFALIVQASNVATVFATGSGSVASLYSTGSVRSTAQTGGGIGAAVDNSGYLWSIGGSGSTLEKISAAGVPVTGFTGAGLVGGTALAIDGAGQVWTTNSGGSLSVFSNTGVAVSPATGYADSSYSGPTGIAIDLSGNVWVSNATANTVDEVIGGAVPVAPLATAVQSNKLGATP